MVLPWRVLGGAHVARSHTLTLPSALDQLLLLFSSDGDPVRFDGALYLNWLRGWIRHFCRNIGKKVLAKDVLGSSNQGEIQLTFSFVVGATSTAAGWGQKVLTLATQFTHSLGQQQCCQ